MHDGNIARQSVAANSSSIAHGVDARRVTPGVPVNLFLRLVEAGTLAGKYRLTFSGKVEGT